MCQRAIAKESSKLVAARVRALHKCEDRKLAGRLPPATLCDADANTATKLAKAASKLVKKIAARCGGDDGVCNGDVAEESPAALGFAAACPDFAASGCSFGMVDCADVTACVECIAGAATTRTTTGLFDSMVPADPSAASDLNKCQRTIGREAARLAVAKDKTVQKCWDGRLRGRHGDTCPDGAAGPGSGGRKAADKIQKAEARYVKKICRACGGGDKACDDSLVGPGGSLFPGSGGNDDTTAADIGFSAECSDAASGSGGTACSGPVTTLGDLVECVACLGDVAGACVDGARVPGFGVYPCACNP